MNIHITPKRFFAGLGNPSQTHLPEVAFDLLSLTTDSLTFSAILFGWYNVTYNGFAWVILLFIIFLSSIHAFVCIKS